MCFTEFQVFIIPLWDRLYSYPSFEDQETEIQRGFITCSRFLSYKWWILTI